MKVHRMINTRSYNTELFLAVERGGKEITWIIFCQMKKLFICVRMFPGVNLLVGTENGLKLLDRSGQGKVYPLINSRRFQQMDVLEGLNLLITISGH